VAFEIDLADLAKIVFDEDGLGSIRFMSTRADLDCRFRDRAGQVFAEFTWAGYRDGTPVLGRGWACVLKTGGVAHPVPWTQVCLMRRA